MNTDPKLDFPEEVLLFTKKLPSHESLFVIQNYNFELRELLNNKREVLKELEFHKYKAENELKSIEFAINNVNSETEKVKLLLQADIESEEIWKEKLKSTEERKLASLLEYRTKMADYRAQLFSCVGVNDEAVALEMDEISAKLQLISTEINNAKLTLNKTIEEFRVAQESKDEELIQRIRLLRDQISSENDYQKDCEILETEIKKITEQLGLIK